MLIPIARTKKDVWPKKVIVLFWLLLKSEYINRGLLIPTGLFKQNKKWVKQPCGANNKIKNWKKKKTFYYWGKAKKQIN